MIFLSTEQKAHIHMNCSFFPAALRKDKSLGIMSQKFLMLFLVSKVINGFFLFELSSCECRGILFQVVRLNMSMKTFFIQFF